MQYIAMESFATPYPIIFHDGDRDHDKGQIGLHSVLTFKRFQALLSQKIGVPANQLSTVFVCKRTAKDIDKRQKLPINENTNFNIILNQHNPIWEKDCHFLVAMKKSKKERKGSRKRTAEADNGDDVESVSSRGDLSPLDERPKPDGSAGVTSSQADTQEPRPSIQSSPESVNSVNQRVCRTASPDLKSGSEKILLRREQTRPGSPRPSGGQNGSHVDKQVGLISINSAQVESSGSEQDSSPHKRDARSAEKFSGQNEPRDGIPAHRSDQKLVAGQPSQLQGAAPRTGEALQGRNNNATPSRPTVLLQRNGILNLSGTVASAPLFPTVPASRPLLYVPAAGMLVPRVSSGISGLASGTSAALNLQQAQAHYHNLQAQHSDQMHLTQQALSKMRGVMRGLAAYESGSQKASSICRHCRTFRERNINPTPFHLCVHDRVTNGFRGPSPAGPIERPVKRLEAAA